jgi:ABC-type antimicrobial peptide transport system permease subunit
VETPPIIGVNPREFERRGAFSFAESIQKEKRQNPWRLLESNSNGDGETIPAIADQSVITWSLHKKIGETILYTDERGREFKLELVGGLKNSIFQGSVLISESIFLQRFPSKSGYKVFLVDAPLGKIEDISEAVKRALRDFGVELVPTGVRLSNFNEVQNTYLSIYLLLGGLGLVVGSFGMGLVVLRNVLERRGELALLRSIGFSRRSVRMLLFIEHSLMFGVGLLCGIFSSIIAVAPILFSRGHEVPYLFLLILCCIIAVNGVLWIYLATIFATRGSLLNALRNE